MSSKTFNLKLTASTSNLYEFLQNSCVGHSNYLKPLPLGSFVHGIADDTDMIDPSLPTVDDSYDKIRWTIVKNDWASFQEGTIGMPAFQYIELYNLNPFGQDGVGYYDRPLTKTEWKKYIVVQGGQGDVVAPNGRFYVAPDQVDPGENPTVTVKIAEDNPGIMLGFGIAFTLPVGPSKEIYYCRVDPVANIKKKKN